MNWQERLIKESEKIVFHGQGQGRFNVGPYQKDKISVLITFGKTWKYILNKRVDIEED